MEHRDIEKHNFRQRPTFSQIIIVSGKRMMLNYCGTCNVFRPPRSAHCIVSNSCVERFDHFCPWIGNTVGKRNYRHFFSFLAVGTLHIVYVLAACVVVIVEAFAGWEGQVRLQGQSLVNFCGDSRSL